MPRRGLSRGSKDRLRQLIGLAQSRRKLNSAHAASGFVFFPPGARQIAAHHALDREHLRPPDQHGAAAELVGIFLHFCRIARHVSSDNVVGDQVFQEVKPEARNLREHPALMRNAGSQHVIECRDPVSSHKEQMVAPHLIHIAYFAAGKQLQIREVSL